MDFSKPAFTTEQHLLHLRGKGLQINDEATFVKELEGIGYFRLLGYLFPFRKSHADHTFRAGTTDFDVISHYHFDCELRELVMGAVSLLEVAFKARFGNLTALAMGPHWYLNDENFNDRNLHSQFLSYVSDHCSKTSERFVGEYRRKYSNPVLPPIWMVMELISFGELVNLFQNLKDNDTKKEIARFWGQPERILVSWLKSMNFVRNCCAHHSRLWNRRLPLKPILPKREKYMVLSAKGDGFEDQMFGILTCMLSLLETLGERLHFLDSLIILFGKYPEINLAQMGFPEGWQAERLWSK
jgi:abortive infection bacteriophage resistance protein